MNERKVLLIEDDPDHADLIKEGLADEGIETEIILVQDGMEALDYFQELAIKWNGQIDYKIKLIILDFNLAKVSGMDILKFLKKDSMYDKIPVIALSTSSDQETIIEAYKNGADGYITKPLYYHEFVDKIKMLREYWSDKNILPLQL